MRKTLAIVGVLCSLAAAYALGFNGAQSAQANEQTPSTSRGSQPLVGTWGFHATGKILSEGGSMMPGTGEFSSNGVFVFKADGTLTAVESFNLEGEINDVTFSGTWMLNPNNTGKIVTVDDAGGVSTLDLVLTARGQRGTMNIRDEGIITIVEMERQ